MFFSTALTVGRASTRRSVTPQQLQSTTLPLSLYRQLSLSSTPTTQSRNFRKFPTLCQQSQKQSQSRRRISNVRQQQQQQSERRLQQHHDTASVLALDSLEKVRPLATARRASFTDAEMQRQLQTLKLASSKHELMHLLDHYASSSSCSLTPVHVGVAVRRCRDWQAFSIALEVLQKGQALGKSDQVSCGIALSFARSLDQARRVLQLLPPHQALDWQRDEVMLSSLLRVCSLDRKATLQDAMHLWQLLVRAASAPTKNNNNLNYFQSEKNDKNGVEKNESESESESERKRRLERGLGPSTASFVNMFSVCASLRNLELAHVLWWQCLEQHRRTQGRKPLDTERLHAFLRVAVACDDLDLVRQLDLMRVACAFDERPRRASLLAPYYLGKRGFEREATQILRRTLFLTFLSENVKNEKASFLSSLNLNLNLSADERLRDWCVLVISCLYSRIKYYCSTLQWQEEESDLEKQKQKRKRLKLWQTLLNFYVNYTKQQEESNEAERSRGRDEHLERSKRQQQERQRREHLQLIRQALFAAHSHNWTECYRVWHHDCLAIFDLPFRQSLSPWVEEEEEDLKKDRRRILLDFHVFSHEETQVALRAIFAFERMRLKQRCLVAAGSGSGSGEEEEEGWWQLRVLCGWSTSVSKQCVRPLAETIAREMAAWTPPIRCARTPDNPGVMECDAADLKRFFDYWEGEGEGDGEGEGEFCKRSVDVIAL